MEKTYQLTVKEQEIIDAYRAVDNLGQDLIECAAKSVMERARLPIQTAQIINFKLSEPK